MAATESAIEKLWFEKLDFLSEDMIAVLKYQVILIANWKWIVLVTGLVLGLLIRPLIQWVLKKIKEHNLIAKKYPKSFWAYLLALQIERPLSWLLLTSLWFAVGHAADLPEKFHTGYDNFVRAFLAFHLIRLLYYVVDAIGSVFSDYAAKTESTMDDQLAPFATKTMKVLVVVLGLLIVLQSFGLNVMSLLAGLGLGGLALALAAQDTAANLFGSITILLDTPFKLGDWVKVKDMEGTVEEIGFRSTRIRTFYNSVITIPNAMMAKETVDNMGMRPFRRIRQNVGIAYETPPEKIEEFCARVRYAIRQDGLVNPDTVSVNFNNFADSSLNILINFHLRAATGQEELDHQEKIFVDILKIGSELGIDFAYPTRTVYHRNVGPAQLT
ncbi:mechanosensitive ion channel family protein [Bdellovibrio sp. HCB2-146]|uniref:mechanosensitive ion channel family protein n=1 Tax=Bdellovibrio sp. HCB2-146 TaxID=3394362 RepID=UPI0039BD7E07